MSKIRQWCSAHHNGLLVAGGFLAGSLGLKALTSETAKKGYVRVVAEGIKAKNAYVDVCEQAKVMVDDVVAEANYIATDADVEKAVCDQQA